MSVQVRPFAQHAVTFARTLESPLLRASQVLLCSHSGGLILETEMLCQRYARYSLRLSHPHTCQRRRKRGMHIRQLIHLEMLTLLSLD